jgi:RHS repeat-associated protein
VAITGEPGDNPFQYIGRENDGTGLYYYRARYYSPELQRFISEDPVGFMGGSNFYVYVANNPVNWLDPLGLIHYTGRPPPHTVPVTGATAICLECLESCLRRSTGNKRLDLAVTGGAEKIDHSPCSHHYINQACDISQWNRVRSSDVLGCAALCGFGAGMWENNHWHLQLRPGCGVPPLPNPWRP